jgi:hypothetical protein
MTFSLTSTPVTGSKSYTVSDADVTTLINWATTQFATGGAALTAQQALLAWIQAMVNATVQQVHDANAKSAAQTAAAGVSNISMT